MIDEGGDVDEVDMGQEVQQRIAYIENGDFATGTCVQPIFEDIYRHRITSFKIRRLESAFTFLLPIQNLLPLLIIFCLGLAQVFLPVR
jgi:hypothetical protein